MRTLTDNWHVRLIYLLERVRFSWDPNELSDGELDACLDMLRAQPERVVLRGGSADGNSWPLDYPGQLRPTIELYKRGRAPSDDPPAYVITEHYRLSNERDSEGRWIYVLVGETTE